MMDVCAYAVKIGEKIADEVEAVYTKNIDTTIEAELGNISKATKTKNEGLRVRVIKDKAMGSVFTYRTDKTSVKTAIEKAVAAARASKRDEYWDSLPSPRAYQRVDVCDPSLETVDSQALTTPVIDMVNMIPEDIIIAVAFNGVTLFERGCVNSNGIEHADKTGFEGYGMAATGKLKEGVTPEFLELHYSRAYNPDPSMVCNNVTKKVNWFKNAETASTGTSQIVFDPEDLQYLFYFTLSKALSGENVARGKSLLAGKEGEEIADPTFTLHDNGIIKKGVNSREMDDEGVPRQDTALIEDGVLQGFIWNDYWAKRMGKTSTGNAFYRARTNVMDIEQTTLTVSPGDCSTEEIFDIADGYYVLGLQGVHGSNPESGDFSVACNPAYRIRNGEITGGVIGMMMSDNVFSLLKRIDAIGRELHAVESAILPLMRFSGMNVAAR
jgi:PmbA protein